MAAVLAHKSEVRLEILLLDGAALIQRWTVQRLPRHLIGPEKAGSPLRGSRAMQRLGWKLIRHFIAAATSDGM